MSSSGSQVNPGGLWMLSRLSWRRIEDLRGVTTGYQLWTIVLASICGSNRPITDAHILS